MLQLSGQVHLHIEVVATLCTNNKHCVSEVHCQPAKSKQTLVLQCWAERASHWQRAYFEDAGPLCPHVSTNAMHSLHWFEAPGHTLYLYYSFDATGNAYGMAKHVLSCANSVNPSCAFCLNK